MLSIILSSCNSLTLLTPNAITADQSEPESTPKPTTIKTTVQTTEIAEEIAEELIVDPTQVEAGIVLYKELYCGACHTFGPAEAGGIFGPTHDGMQKIAEQRIQSESYQGPSTTVTDYLRESIVDPNVYVIEEFIGSRYAMPPYTHLSNEEVDALVVALLYGQSTSP